MRFTGISRPIDELGRIVIPKEIRNALDMRPKDEIEIYIEDGNMIMKKAKPFCSLCAATEELHSFSGKFICQDCIKKLQNFPE